MSLYFAEAPGQAAEGVLTSSTEKAQVDRAVHATSAITSDLETASTPDYLEIESTSSASPSTIGRRVMRVAPSEYRVSGLKAWTGRVLDVDGDLFTAELVPDQHTPGVPVLADFPVEELDLGADILVPGDVIYVTVRTTRPALGGLPRQTSSVRLRRLGKWTKTEVATFEAAGRAMKAELEDFMD